MFERSVIVLTGGPGGGKSKLIEELRQPPAWRYPFTALPEAVFTLRDTGISIEEKLFQRVIVYIQMALEDGMKHALPTDDSRVIICHRGSLDPLAYWISRGWLERDFFEFTGTTQDQHYQRYTAVIHLVTSADGAEAAYRRWPDSHRAETVDEAIRLDRLLQHAWSGHPRYYRIDNTCMDWQEKSANAKKILEKILLDSM